MSDTMRRKVSIRDVARELGVSITTVSFVLNGRAKEMRISPELEKKVLEYTGRIGYLPRQQGRSPQGSKSHLIAMLVEDMSDAFFSALIRMVEQKAFERGYTLIAASTHGDAQRARMLIRNFRAQQIDAWLIAPPAGMEKDIRSLLNDRLPVVLFDGCYPGLPTINVVRDHAPVVRRTTSRLMAKGCRNIALITTDALPMASWINGYRRAIREQALPEHLLRIHEGLNAEEMRAAIASFFEYNEQLDAAIFAGKILSSCGREVLAGFSPREGKNILAACLEEDAWPVLGKAVPGAGAQAVSLLAEEVIQELFDQLEKTRPGLVAKTIVLPTDLWEKNVFTPLLKTFSREVVPFRARQRVAGEVYY